MTGKEPERTPALEAYLLGSRTVELLNRVIDETTEPAKREHFKAALREAHGMEDALARAVELEAKAKGLE